MIKVLEIISGLNKGGTESFLLAYINELKKKGGFEFDIYSYSFDDLDIVKKFEDLGCNIYKGTAPSKKHLFKSYKYFNNFLSIHNDYDVIHCNCNLDNFLFLYVSYFHGIKNRLGHYHDTTTGIKFSFKTKLFNSFKRLICKLYCTDSLGCSKQALIDQIGKKNKGTVIRNIIDVEYFKNVNNEKILNLKTQYNLNNDDFVIGNISRFEPKKNQEFMVRLFKEVYLVNKKAKLVLGGTGDDSNIKLLVNQLGINDSVIFIGPRNDVEVWYHIFDFYLMPSLFEGFGISAVEAQAANCHVLASKNLPADTDFGNIEYLDLTDMNAWKEALRTNKTYKTLGIDNNKYVTLFINFLSK